MKLLILLAGTLLGISLPSHSEVSPIRMDVEQKSKTEIKPREIWNKTQIRSLTIKLSNNSANSFDNLVVKYWFFGREAEGNDVKILREGERKARLGPRGRETIESEQVAISYVEAHSEAPKGKSYGAGKKVPASGQKIMGYALQVLDGSKVLAETYSEPSYRQKLAPPAK